MTAAQHTQRIGIGRMLAHTKELAALDNEVRANLKQFGHVESVQREHLAQPSLAFCLTATTIRPTFERRTAEGFLDLRVGTFPARFASKIKLDVSEADRAFWKARERVGGTVRILVKLLPHKDGSVWYGLFAGAQAADHLGIGGGPELDRHCLTAWADALPEGQEFARWLVS